MKAECSEPSDNHENDYDYAPHTNFHLIIALRSRLLKVRRPTRRTVCIVLDTTALRRRIEATRIEDALSEGIWGTSIE